MFGLLDLRFRVFGISICIKLTFWIVWLVVGLYFVHLDIGTLLMWMGVLFVSVFVHNLAHAIMGRLCGARTGIVIDAFGGGPTGFEGLGRWQRILLFAAGPVASFALMGAVELYRSHGNPFAWGAN